MRAIIAGLAALAGLASAAPLAAQAPATVIATEGGRVSGTAISGGVRAWLGIPYAAPPVRDLRWREPQPAPAWQGVLRADRFGPQCVQPMRDARSNHYSGPERISEDCLTINVWARPGQRKAPVIVYIHGGAFFIGSGSNGIYGGEGVAGAGAVFVNFNYRLGPLGFLALPELSAQSPHRTSGNYGLMDQIAALHWVQRNIAAFGGDPGNVTIVGQSAGSMSVLALQASPLARGLFHKAVGMSGAMIAGPLTMPSRDDAERASTQLMAAWRARSLADLRALPADRLVVPRVANGPSTGPSVDGHVLPMPIAEAFARGLHSDVPLILGFTQDESFGGLGPVSGLADYGARAKARFGASAPQFLALYPAASDEEARRQARAADRDGTMVIAMAAWARLQVDHGTAPVWSYHFARPHSYAPDAAFSDLDPQTAGAYHTSEVPFWLGTLDAFNRFRPTRAWTPQDRAMSAAMVRTLVAFARHGQPDGEGLTWPRFDPRQPQLVEFGTTARIAPWPDQRRLQFFAASLAATQPD